MGRSIVCGLVFLVACGTSSTSTPTPDAPVAQSNVGSTGGTVKTPDGSLTIDIPAGALPDDVKITVTEIAAPQPGTIGKAYEIGPTGTQFAKPVTLSFSYAGLDLQGNAPSDLGVATIESGEWTALAGDTVDDNAHVASGTTMHLSPYALVGKPHGNKHDDAGDDSGPVDSGPTDSGNDADNDAGSINDGGDGGDAGCVNVHSPQGTCANQIGACYQYPGYVKGACTNDDASIGYTIVCCPP